MKVQDYCKSVSSELNGWKAKMYDVVRKLDKMPTGEKEKLVPTVNELHMIIEGINDRIYNLEKSCPTEWKSDEEEISSRMKEVETKMKGVWDPLHIGK
jgi:hypothetical protein